MLELDSHVDSLCIKIGICNKQNRYKWKRNDKLHRLYVTRAQYNVTCKLCSGGEGRAAIVYHYSRISQGPKRQQFNLWQLKSFQNPINLQSFASTITKSNMLTNPNPSPLILNPFIPYNFFMVNGDCERYID